ncbi:carboxylesterase family protein [Microbacterium hydrocarbonoxydans]|uniref:carboxylesterase family protein n=1 Tax=Microbacterium hydrocarbonoxydans TaxID=273678 RepID=UPI0007BB7E28|nr:carboxylesterase family protein [Microbacterium hydrocarbonoxydans]GAT74028.1 carboxylesterase type B [Microbacterium sp. HM58-2]
MDDGPVVGTAEGPIRGLRRAHDLAFLGIPFAAAPVGPLRFLAPQPVEPWTGIRDATAFGPTPQRREEPGALIPEPSVPGAEILNLNVFTPALAPAALPVLVWIHGGAYSAGSAIGPWYDGRTFTRDGVVTVTVSYRLGSTASVSSTARPTTAACATGWRRWSGCIATSLPSAATPGG